MPSVVDLEEAVAALTSTQCRRVESAFALGDCQCPFFQLIGPGVANELNNFGLCEAILGLFCRWVSHCGNAHLITGQDAGGLFGTVDFQNLS